MHSSTTSRQIEAIGSYLSTTLSGTINLESTYEEQASWLQRYINILYFESSYGLPTSIATRIADSSQSIEWWLAEHPELFI